MIQQSIINFIVSSVNDMRCFLCYSKEMDSAQPPSYWLKLLQERTGIVFSFKQGLTDEEFDALCWDEPRFHQDVLLELRDLTAIAEHFTQAVKKPTVF